MPEQLLNSFLGMPSTNELPAAGLLKTTSNSLQTNQNSKGENSFLAKLAYSMNNKSTIDDKDSTLSPSELNNISSIEGINHLIDMASMDAPTNITTNVHGDQTPLYQALNHGIPIEVFTDGIINNTDNGKTSPVQTQANTIPSHTLTVNQGSSAINKPENLTRIVQEIARGQFPGLTSTSFTDKSNTSQINSKTNDQNITDILNKLNPAKIAGTTSEEPPPPPPPPPPSSSSTIPDKQIVESHKGASTKTDEQNVTGILSKLNPAKIAATTDEEPPSQSSKIPGKQIAESHKGANTNQINQNNAKTDELNAAGILNKLNPAKTAATTGEEPLSQSSKISDKQIAESHKGTNTNQNNAKINKQNTVNTNKLDNASIIEKTSPELTTQASKASDSSTNSLSQYNSRPAQTDSNESHKIFDIRPETAGAIVPKPSDNTTTINNSGINSVNADEVVLQLNTSSNNSSFNSQGADTPNESYSNAVTASQKAEPGVNFTSTLSQISNSTIPFESLGRDTADNIIQKAKLFMEGGKSEVKIQLNPPELGILKLEFEVEDDNLELKIKVERSGVKDVIEKDIPRLRELLSNADVDVGKLDVSLQEKEDEKLSLMDKDLQSDSESDSTKDLQGQDSEILEDGIDEESIEYDEDSNRINFLV